MEEMNLAEVEQVGGGLIPVVAWKIGAWAAGAIFGAGLAVAIREFTD